MIGKIINPETLSLLSARFSEVPGGSGSFFSPKPTVSGHFLELSLIKGRDEPPPEGPYLFRDPSGIRRDEPPPEGPSLFRDSPERFGKFPDDFNQNLKNKRHDHFFACSFGTLMAFSGFSRRHGWIPRVRVITKSGLDSFGSLLGVRLDPRGMLEKSRGIFPGDRGRLTRLLRASRPPPRCAGAAAPSRTQKHLAHVPENGSPENLRTNRDHFRDQLGPVESSRDDKKLQKRTLRLQTDPENCQN